MEKAFDYDCIANKVMNLIAVYSIVLVHENMVMNMLGPNVSKVVGISFSILIKINILM